MGHPSQNLPELHRRGYSRLRLQMEAAILTLDGRRPVTLLDLSQSGARMLLDEHYRVDQAVLYWIGFEAFGEVAWQAGRDVGLQFEEPLSAETVIATRQWRPKEEARQDIAERRKFAQGWVNGRL